MQRPNLLVDLPDAQLFSNIAETDQDVPQPELDKPSEEYLAKLLGTFSDPSQRAIVTGMWELAGLAGDEATDQTVEDSEQVAQLRDTLEDMSLGFRIFDMARNKRAGRLILKSARDEITLDRLPSSLLLADPDRVPKTSEPEAEEQFTDYINDLMGLGSASERASQEVLAILKNIKDGKLVYNPADFRFKYMAIASALPCAHIPDEVGQIIYDLRHGSAGYGLLREQRPSHAS